MFGRKMGQSAGNSAASVALRIRGKKVANFSGARVGGVEQPRFAKSKFEGLGIRECVQMHCKQYMIIPF